MRISGVMVQYYVACTRELWFFTHQINMNYDNDDILTGRLIHERSYAKERKNIQLDGVCFDIVHQGEENVVFEIKKSSKLSEPALYQLYYYLYYLKHVFGQEFTGVVLYPKERRREVLRLDEEKEIEIANILRGIEEVAAMEKPPKRVKKPYCKGCSYYELCFV